MKKIIKKEKGVTMVALVITVIILLILTNMLIYNATDSAQIKSLTSLYNDIELLREKVSEYYNEYGKIPAKIKYTNTSELSSVLSSTNDTGDFYIIDLEAMQGISLNYGKDYEKAKNDSQNANTYKDIYIINENSQNIFYAKGITITKGDTTQTYYTDYIEPDNSTVDLRYIEGILIPDGYYYIGKTKDKNGNESIVISSNKEDKIDSTNTNQYTWTKQISKLGTKPDSVKLDTNQKEEEFLTSVNVNQGYFKNTEGKVQYIIVDEENWSEAYTKEMQYTDRKGDTITIPKGCKISLASTMNTIDEGFVIKDSNDNEWVWVVVPENIFKTAKSDTDYDNIKADLIEYAKDYRKGSSTQNLDWKDEWYDGCGLSKDEYDKNYKKMLSSVFNNHGFWISRYEIGDSTATASNATRTSKSGTTGKAVSKPNQIPYNYVTCSESQTLASKMSPDSNKTSSLLFGIQWDLTCKFLEEYTDLTYADIATDSTNWGNYKNSTFNITNEKAKQAIFDFSTMKLEGWTQAADKKRENSILLTTGATENTKILNIYEFAGNEWEYTLEHAKLDSRYPCNTRGGGYTYSGIGDPASSRGSPSKIDSYDCNGFRVTLY